MNIARTMMAATACTNLANLPIALEPPARIVSLAAQDVTGGSFTPPSGGPALTNLPPFCRVTALVSSSGDPATSQSAVELWLPEQGWNGRFEGFGNSGFAGTILYGALQLGLSEGFAAANTDMGTSRIGGTPGGLYQDSPAIRDFGYAATHLMTLAARQLVAAYYAQPARYTYFNGCSTGGQQAMAESQRYPDDYDGILAGAPAYDRTHLHMAGTAAYEATHFVPDANLTTAALALAHSLVLHHCTGRDGGLRTDAFLTQPALCSVHARSLICTGQPADVPCSDPKAATCTCLSTDQARVIDHIWTAAVDDHGRTLYPGIERGVEQPVPAAPNPAGGTEPAFSSLFGWALGPNWIWQDLFNNTAALQPELAAEIATIDNTPVGDSTFANVLNAVSTALAVFGQNGHRMIMYAGYADPLVPTASAIDYVNAVKANDPAADTYLRLFLAPGLWHCGGGPGANIFGNLSDKSPPVPLSPADDLLGALITWVETGQPPTKVIATKYVNDTASQGIAFQRPLCQYPANAAYVSGNPTLAASFTCAPGDKVTTQPFPAPYGP